MKTLTLLLLLLAGIPNLLAQSMPTPPEPILPLKEAGQYAPKLEKLRTALSEKKIKEFTAILSEIGREINEKQEDRGVSKKDATKEEFVANEWRYYFVCRVPLPPANEIWEKFETPLSNRAYDTITQLSANPYTAISNFELDKKRLCQIRAVYLAILLRRLCDRKKEVDDEVLGIKVRYAEHENKRRVATWDAFVRNRFETEEYRFHRTVSEFKFNRGRKTIEYAKISLKMQIKSSEKIFLRFLFTHFHDNPSVVHEYLKMAGYNDEYKRAALLLRMQKEFRKSGDDDRLFERYAKKMKLNQKRLEALAARENARNLAEIERVKKVWAQRAAVAKAEHDAQSIAIRKAQEGYRAKTNAGKKESAPADTKPNKN
jgi:hypothetical protein